MLPPADILGHAYGIEPHPEGPGSALTEFAFSKGLQGWQGRADASARAGADAMLVTGQSPRGFVLRQGLDAQIGKKDFVSLRMTLNCGTRGELIFVTTMGAGRIRFPTKADGKPHTYVIEPWTWPGWGGRLLALGLAPSETPAWTAAITYLRLTEQIQAEPELSVVDIFPSATLPRSGRPETIVARIRNMGGIASNVQATLTAPTGVSLEGAKVLPLGTIAFRETRDATWTVRASGPMTSAFQTAVLADGAPPFVKDQLLRFHERLDLPKTDYVPEPVSLPTGRYTLWTHYCPLWKTGTHTGWGAIEPWPERKPVLGWYNEGDPEVADWHIKYWLEHGITGVIYCWYRSNLNAPVTQTLGHAIHDALLKARYSVAHQIRHHVGERMRPGGRLHARLAGQPAPVLDRELFLPSLLSPRGRQAGALHLGPAKRHAAPRIEPGSAPRFRHYARPLSGERPGRPLYCRMRGHRRPAGAGVDGRGRLGCQFGLRRGLAATGGSQNGGRFLLRSV